MMNKDKLLKYIKSPRWVIASIVVATLLFKFALYLLSEPRMLIAMGILCAFVTFAIYIVLALVCDTWNVFKIDHTNTDYDRYF